MTDVKPRAGPNMYLKMVRFRVQYRTMIKANIAEVKAHLSQYLESVERGETVILCRRNVPIAEIRPIPKLPDQQSPIGTDPGLKVPDSFLEPLPDEILRAFRGGDESS